MIDFDDILQFWFRELREEQWFKADPGLDQAIRDRFLDAHEAIAASPPKQTPDPRTALAGVIALDQFPRNMFRRTPRAFATDPIALALASATVDRGLDKTLSNKERSFLYLPFEHSEDAAVQVRSIELFTGLGDANALDYAQRHKAIIDRFGRYPHRNAVLGRPSTAEELEFLQQPGSSF
jgi:uncharacterized protein (DUF924 family)